jgi:hypothetical protein
LLIVEANNTHFVTKSLGAYTHKAWHIYPMYKFALLGADCTIVYAEEPLKVGKLYLDDPQVEKSAITRAVSANLHPSPNLNNFDLPHIRKIPQFVRP